METKQTDAELVTRIKTTKCNDSLKELINRHSPLCYDVCRKYAPALSNKGIDLNDVTSEKDFLIYKSVLSFNPEKKTKFSTWLGNQVRYHCLNLMNKNNLIATEDSRLDYFIHKDITYEAESVENKMEYIFNLVSQLKDKRIKRVIKIRYFQNPNKKTPWNKVAEKLGVSTQTAINLHNKAICLLRKKIENKNIYAVDRI